MKISEVINKTGLTKRAVRYYEDEGLITPVINSENNYREYSSNEADRLLKISLLRQIDLSIVDIKKLMDKPSSVKEILEKHIAKIEENINRLKVSKSLISEIVDNNNIVDSEDFMSKLKYFKEYIDDEDKRKYGYVKRQFQKVFPGMYGKMLMLHFSAFLNEPIDTKEKEVALADIIDYLDNTDVIKCTKEMEQIYNDYSEEDMDKFAEGNNKNIRRIINFSNEEFEAYKKEIMQYIKAIEENEEFKKERSKMWEKNKPVKNQMMESGYYEKFVNNLRILSKDYDKYQKNLYKLNDELGLKYDEKGNIVFV